MAGEVEAGVGAQIWRPKSCPGLEVYRVSGRGSSQALHVHDEEIQLTLDACHVQQVSCGGRLLTALPGSMVIIPPGEVHALRTEGGRPGMVYGMLIPLRGEPSEELDWEATPVDEVLPGGGAVLEDLELSRDFVALHRALRSSHPSREHVAMLRELLARVLGLLRAPASRYALGWRSSALEEGR